MQSLHQVHTEESDYTLLVCVGQRFKSSATPRAIRSQPSVLRVVHRWRSIANTSGVQARQLEVFVINSGCIWPNTIRLLLIGHRLLARSEETSLSGLPDGPGIIQKLLTNLVEVPASIERGWQAQIMPKSPSGNCSTTKAQQWEPAWTLIRFRRKQSTAARSLVV